MVKLNTINIGSTLALVAALTSCGAPAFAQPVAAAPTDSVLGSILSRGSLNCGVMVGLYGFSLADSRGELTGFDVDTCKALTAALFTDTEGSSARRLRFRQLTFQNRFAELHAGQVDIVAGQTTRTEDRERNQGLAFPLINLVASQGFIVRADLGVRSARELDGARICMGMGTTTELLVSRWARENGIQFRPIVFEQSDILLNAFFSGSCDTLVSSFHLLAGLRASRGPNAERDFLILPEELTLEPNGPVVRQSSDRRWFNVVQRVLAVLITAEELGVTQHNVMEFTERASRRDPSLDPRILQLLAANEAVDRALGIPAGWATRAISAVGNYGEVWERHLGQNSPLRLPRGRNDLPSRGGQLVVPQFAP